MDIVFNFLLITHLLALVVGTATAIAMPVVMGRLAGTGPEAGQLGAAIGGRLGLNSRIAFGILLLSGFGMVWVRYGGVDGLNVWFWVKMGLIALVLVSMIAAAVLPRGAVSPRTMGWIVRLSLLGIIVSAVLAFH
jgi:hypothetical protein